MSWNKGLILVDKLHISNEMRQLDLKNRNFYDELTDEEKKKFSTFLMIRWGSCVDGSRELQEYYVQSTNHYLNKHFFAINRHPKLQWLCATAVSPGLGTQRHNWIKTKKKEDSNSAVKKKLLELYPTRKEDDIDALAKIVTDQDIKEYLRKHGD
jgi:hypothetical protein